MRKMLWGLGLELDLYRDIGLAIVFMILLIPVLFWKIQAVFKWFKFFQSLPGEPSYSFLYGNLHKLPKDPEGILDYGQYLTDTCNKFSRFWMGPFKPIIVVSHPETVRTLLKSSAPKSRGFGRVYELIIPWIGEGLIVSNGPKWHRSRRLITPAFHFDILKQYLEVYNDAADRLVKKLDDHADSGKPFDISWLIKMCTLDVVLKCAMSYDIDVLERGDDPYVGANWHLGEAFINRTRNPFHWSEFVFKCTRIGRKFFEDCKFVQSETEKVIAQRKAQLSVDGPPKKRLLDFIDILLMARDEDGQPMDSQHIRDEVNTFMFAGHDTTASNLTWFLYCLAKYPQYQIKIQQEIDAVLEGRDSQHILWEDLSQLNMLVLCLKEAQRLYPPVPFIERTLTEAMDIDGHMIPAATSVVIAIVHMHRNPSVWDEPEEYRPERFLPDQMKNKDSFSFVPFSAGARNCIGQHFALDELKVVTSRVLARYTVELAPGYPAPRRYPQATMQCQNGMWLQLKARSTKTA